MEEEIRESLEKSFSDSHICTIAGDRSHVDFVAPSIGHCVVRRCLSEWIDMQLTYSGLLVGIDNGQQTYFALGECLVRAPAACTQMNASHGSRPQHLLVEAAKSSSQDWNDLMIEDVQTFSNADGLLEPRH